MRNHLTTAVKFSIWATLLLSGYVHGADLRTTQPALSCASVGPCVASFRVAFSDPRRAGEVARTVPVECSVKAAYRAPNHFSGGYGNETATSKTSTYAWIRAGVIDSEVQVELKGLPATATNVLLSGATCTIPL